MRFIFAILHLFLFLRLCTSLFTCQCRFPKFPPSILHLSTYNAESNQDELKKEALSLLECLTSPKDPDDPGYDVEKDIRRDNLLYINDYETLKIQLRARGLRTSGDKLEMISRLLLHILDPSIVYNEGTGREPKLEYVSEEDLNSTSVRLVPEAERQKSGDIPDAEDVAVLRQRTNQEENSPGQARQIMMDGLSRREMRFTPITLKRGLLVENVRATESRNEKAVLPEDRNIEIDAYIVGGRDVLKTWEKSSTVIILLPDHRGWKNKHNRILADEIAFAIQAIVVVPDIYRGEQFDEVMQADLRSMAPAEESKTLSSWLDATQPSSRVFDDVIGALCFARAEFGSAKGRLGLAGVGVGGGIALGVMADLDRLCEEDDKVLDSKPPANKAKKESIKDSLLGTVARASKMPLSPSGNDVTGLAEMIREIAKSDPEIDNLMRQLTGGEEGVPEDEDATVAQTHSTDDEEELTEEEDDEEEEAEAGEEPSTPSLSDWETELLATVLPQSAPLLSSPFSLSLPQLKALRPSALLAISPRFYDAASVGDHLTSPTCLLAGEIGSTNSTLDMALFCKLEKRIKEVRDLCVRVYEGRFPDFLHIPESLEDEQAAQDALAIGALWLDAFSQLPEDGTTGMWQSKNYNPIIKVPMASLDNPIRGSVLARHVHDDPYFFKKRS